MLGGAACLHDDIAAYRGPVDGVVACNEAGLEWPGALDAWVSLHPRFLVQKKWLAMRAAKGFPAAAAIYCHQNGKEPLPSGMIKTALELPGQRDMQSGSSGLLAAKVALVDLGFDRIVLCGVPMNPVPHLHGRTTWLGPRSPVEGFRRAWLDLTPEIRARMRSMSGWTRVLLGAPEMEMINAEA